MVSVIFGIFIVIGVVFSICTGRVEVLNNQILQGASEGIQLLFSMLPVLVLWTGVMKIAEESGMLKQFAKFVQPFLCKLFPSLKKEDPALTFIASNIAANALGLGSAATPFGLKAMASLQENNPKKDEATEAMVTFLVLNTAGVTIIPTTVIALRMSYGSANPAEIVLTSLLATFCSSFAGFLLDYILRKRKRR